MQLAYTTLPTSLCLVMGTVLIFGWMDNVGCKIRQLTSKFDFTSSIKNQGKNFGKFRLKRNVWKSGFSSASLCDNQATNRQLSSPSNSNKGSKWPDNNNHRMNNIKVVMSVCFSIVRQSIRYHIVND